MHKGTILVVDRDGEALEGICAVLRGAGYETLPTMSCIAEVREIIAHPPDLVIMDACTHCVQKEKALQFDVRHGCGARELPVIMLTERADQQSFDCAFRAGIEKYLLKPFEPAELLLAVDELLARASTETA